MSADSTEVRASVTGGGWRELLVVLLAGSALAVVLTYPFAFQMTHVGRVDTSDGEFSIWNVAWVARTLIADPRHVLDANIFYPHNGTLMYSETNLGAGALAIPAYWATRNPVFALNFVFLLSLTLSAAGGYYLVRYLVGDRRPAAVAAVCFGFCPYVFARTPHIQLLMTAGLPFSMLAFHRLADRPTAGRAAALGMTMATQAAFCGYYAVFVILMVGYGTLMMAWLRGLWTNARYWRTILIAALIASIAVIPVVLPYVQLTRGTGFRRELEEARRYSANWQAYLASNAMAHVWMLALLKHWNEVLFPGFVTTIGGVAGVVLGWRRGGRLREAAILYGALAVLACWASFGPAAGLYTVLYKILPPFSLMRAPARFGVIVAFGLAALTGVAVKEVLVRIAWPTVVAVLMVILAAADLAVPLNQSVMREVPPLSPAYSVLRTFPAAPVIELPFFSTGLELHGHARYMRYSVSHWMPLINGYSDYIPPDFVEEAQTLRSFPSREAFRLLAAKEPRYAVFHMLIYGEDERAQVAARIDEFSRDLKPLYIDAETRLYEIVGFSP